MPDIMDTPGQTPLPQIWLRFSRKLRMAFWTRRSAGASATRFTPRVIRAILLCRLKSSWAESNRSSHSYRKSLGFSRVADEETDPRCRPDPDRRPDLVRKQSDAHGSGKPDDRGSKSSQGSAADGGIRA